MMLLPRSESLDSFKKIIINNKTIINNYDELSICWIVSSERSIIEVKQHKKNEYYYCHT